ncbi:hypothetical protein DFH08DRAFT_953471 [Mycena albidolilacea]|uniref:CxC2-like cysteine cluster KDZ transposase-associated domain-containing protein n=1 Tax=Mycena albidolilacea TaxID=1033008 RepID=A0AAD7AGU2_9AGAR|nr:hypothetical protein DFH08DRAFT_953471 [Mycena albidolilacea]
MHITADNVFDNAFERLKLDDDSGFHPRKGFEHTHGSENWDFYVVTRGFVPGIYTHWEDASEQVNKFKGSAHKKYAGWSAATSAFRLDIRPSASVNARPKAAASMPHHSTPSHSLVSHPKSEVSMPLTSTPTRKPTHTPHTSTSAPSTPTRPRKALYVYSRGQDTTIFADQKHASAAVRRGLADGSFRKVEVTAMVRDVFERAEESALECYNISDFSDGERRAAVRSLPIQWERDNPPIPDAADDTDWLDLLDESFGTDPDTGHQRKRKRKWYATMDDPLRHWVANYRDEYLRVLVTREGFMGEKPCCPCGQPGIYRCCECSGAQIFCHECMVEQHRLRPLCRIEAWNGSFFDRRELRQLGRHKFVVIAPNGFHHVSVDFCQCRLGGGQPHWEQSLSYGWFPATPDNPQSAITIAALKLFHAVSLQGKTTVYHFFNALAKITDNTGSKAFKRCYPLALRVVRQWRNLRALKRGGMGNNPDRRTAETHQGELAVDCLACPKAGVNLPEGWKDAPVELRYLYTIFLAIDACFRLKRKKISSWLKDPSLQDGWSYFVRSFTYEEFVKTLGEQKEMSTCTGLAALDHANTKYAQGYAATGCGMITCGRHEIVCKNGVGDLQAREKYGNMDYIVASAWHHLRDLLFFLLSYDIMCQWVKNLRERLLKLPPTLRFQLAHYFVKFVVGMGTTLRKRLLQARKELAQQRDALQEFTLAQQGEVAAWKEAVDNFETGASTTNPYQLPHAGPTLKDIELELTREEQEHEQGSSVVPEADEDTMIEYLLLGLEIEGQQRQLAADLLAKKSPTTKELTDFVTWRTQISRQIKKLRQMQRKYSPGALQRIAMAADPAEPAEAEHALLFLPSGLSPLQSAPPLSVPGLAVAEARLCDGQCSESLEVVRHGLIVKRRLQTYKTLNSRRQHQNTRSRSLVDGQQRKVDLAAATYRQARLARLALVHAAGPCSWRTLEKADLHLPEDEEEAKKRRQRAMKSKRKEARQVNENGEVRGVPGMGEKNRLTSWIWFGAGNTEVTVGEAMHEGVRVEWSKAYARVKRWREEERLLQEEMARCLLTLEWQAAEWDQRTTPEHYSDQIAYGAAHMQGAMVFAARQAAVRRQLATRFRRSWWCLLDRVGGGEPPVSSESSGVDERDGPSGGKDSDDDGGWEDEGISAQEPAVSDGNNEGGPEEEEKEDESEDEEEDVARREAEMDELLIIQTTSLAQYDEL